ncbi:MAG: phycobilisome linker polypeptide [Cyanobacteria bacterium P01_H01_bin.152]
MLGQYATSPASSVDSRIFVYEVTGLAENELTVGNRFSIRSSDSQFIQVPFHRMNEVMRRVTLLGGEIVSIQPISSIDQQD